VEQGIATIGVVITIPDPWGEELQERRAGYGDTVAWTIPTHITLLPPTQVPEERLPAVDAHLHQVATVRAPFPVVLRGSDGFRPVTQTSFVVVAEGGDACASLADAVRTGPLRRRLPFPYHPHLTMAVDLTDEVHDRVEAEMSTFTLEFSATAIDRYVLAEHGVWESAAVFPFKASDG
jgi:2'-5' RNA ligase